MAKKKKAEQEIIRCADCRHPLIDHDLNRCRMCWILVLRHSPCYPKDRQVDTIML